MPSTWSESRVLGRRCVVFLADAWTYCICRFANSHALVCALDFCNSHADKANWKLLIESVEFKYVVNKGCVNGMVISMPASQGGWAKCLTSNYPVPVTAGVWKTAILILLFPWPFVFLMVVLFLGIQRCWLFTLVLFWEKKLWLFIYYLFLLADTWWCYRCPNNTYNRNIEQLPNAFMLLLIALYQALWQFSWL